MGVMGPNPTNTAREVKNADWLGKDQDMTDRELRKLSRPELLELLVAQGRELAAVQKQLGEAEKRLEDREILVDEAGSIAEASLQLNDVIGTAQRAADQYTANMRRFCAEHMASCEQEEAQRREAARKALEAAKAQARDIISQAQAQAASIRKDAEEQARRLQEETIESTKDECKRLLDGAQLQAATILSAAKRGEAAPDGTKERKRHFWQRGERG